MGTRFVFLTLLLLCAVESPAQDSPETRQEAACPTHGPACPPRQAPVCHDGRWYCRGYASSAGARAAGFNYPSEEQVREAACGEPALACEVPTIPECRNGRWTCVPPARPVN